MRPLVALESMNTPDGQRLELRRRDDDYYLLLGGEELMSSRNTGSERALAELALAEIGNRESPRLLIGGLGIGYTLRAALDAMPSRGAVVVAELFAPVVAWNRRHLAALHGNALADPRVEIREEDVADVIDGSAPGSWDAILLDVDNGPEAFCLDSNQRLYERSGLQSLHRALAPGGALTIWSAGGDPNPRFQKQLRRTGFDARYELVRSRGRSGYRQGVFVATPQARRPERSKRRR